MDPGFSQVLQLYGDHSSTVNNFTAKLLLDSNSCGVVIGRNGANRTAIQVRYQVRLQCSHPGQYYQGSYDRFALISGPALTNVVGAITHILQLLHGDQLQPATLRLVLPIAAAGAVIGVGGQVQRELMQLSQASIQFAPTAGLIAERVVSISGSYSQVLRATEAVLSKVVGHPSYQLGALADAQPPSTAASAYSPLGNMSLLETQMQQLQLQGLQPTAQLQQLQGLQQAQVAPLSGLQGLQTTAGNQLYPQAAIQQLPYSVLAQPLQSAMAGLPQPSTQLNMQSIQATQQAILPAYPAAIIYQTQPTPVLPNASVYASAGGGGLGPNPAALALAGSAGSALTAALSVPAPPIVNLAEVLLDVPDNRIGVVLGKGGATLEGLKRLLSVRISVSRREPGMAPTAPRRLTITGAAPNVATAQLVITQKLQAFQSRKGARAVQHAAAAAVAAAEGVDAADLASAVSVTAAMSAAMATEAAAAAAGVPVAEGVLGPHWLAQAQTQGTLALEHLVNASLTLPAELPYMPAQPTGIVDVPVLSSTGHSGSAHSGSVNSGSGHSGTMGFADINAAIGSGFPA